MDVKRTTTRLPYVLTLKATASDIPQELFVTILAFVGQDSELRGTTLERWTIKTRDLANCALTCFYWAQQCRPMLHAHILVRNTKVLYALSLLVRNLPPRLPPITDFVRQVHLIQQLNDIPWLHRIAMQPSLLPRQIRSAIIHMRLVASSPNRGNPASPSNDLFRLFPRLPRAVPPVFHKCNTFTIQNCHFRTVQDLKRCLQQVCFDGYGRLHLVRAFWSTSEQVHDSNAKLRLPYRFIAGQATSCPPVTVATAWAAFASMGDPRCHFVRQPRGASAHHQAGTNTRILLHSTDHRFMFDLSVLLHQTVAASGLYDESPSLEISTTPNILRGIQASLGEPDQTCMVLCMCADSIDQTRFAR